MAESTIISSCTVAAYWGRKPLKNHRNQWRCYCVVRIYNPDVGWGGGKCFIWLRKGGLLSDDSYSVPKISFIRLSAQNIGVRPWLYIVPRMEAKLTGYDLNFLKILQQMQIALFLNHEAPCSDFVSDNPTHRVISNKTGGDMRGRSVGLLLL